MKLLLTILKWLFITFFLTGVVWGCMREMGWADEYEEGNFWREDGFKWESNKGIVYKDWKIISQSFFHIIYQSPDKELWTRCHSCGRLVKLEEAHRMILDGRKQAIEHVNWPYRPLWRKIIDFIKRKKRPMISMVDSPGGGRIINYEELYYCDSCYNPDWDR